MKVEITMLNVNDGDAIIIELTKSDQSLVMVIDSGHTGSYSKILRPKLKAILLKHRKPAPDIVVCTHYDSDHIAGLIPLVKDYIAGIKQVWIHKTPQVIENHIAEAVSIQKTDAKKASGTDSLLSLLGPTGLEHNSLLDLEAESLVLRSLPELQELLDLIPSAKKVHVFSDQQPVLPGWEEIRILGPTKSYFNSLFPTNKSLAEFVLEEVRLSLIDEKTDPTLPKKAVASPCERLKDDSTADITSTNKASIIFAIDTGEKRYLFTGDAGIESFKKIPDWKAELKDLYFLKVPHHGSNNNLSKELITVMQPKYAYNSGKNHQDDEVLECIKSKARCIEVRSTKTEGDLFFDQ